MFVSTIIPAFNAVRTVVRTIESALAQTHVQQEVIVVDDGSSDGTADIVTSTFGERVRLLRQANAGASSARNSGIAAARGQLIALLDADDIWLPHKLERQVRYLVANPEVGAVQCGAAFVDEHLRTLEVRPCSSEGDALWDALHFRNLPAFLSALILRQSCLNRIGGFATDLVILEEWDMAIRTARHCDLRSLAEPLVLYRVHPGNRSRNVDIHVAPGLLVLERLFADPALPVRVRRARREVYATFYRMLAGGYFRARRPAEFLRWALRALVTDPRQLGYMVALPRRLLARRAQRSRQ